jgi:hypothetical protein
MPVAERRQETAANGPVLLLSGAVDNWPDTGLGARLRKQADAGQVSP